MSREKKLAALGFLLAGLITACTPAVNQEAAGHPTGEAEFTATTSPTQPPINAETPAPTQSIDPTPSIPDRNRELPQLQIPDYDPGFGFDSIPPIYDPVFTGADKAPLLANELVIGTSLNGESKAYPITVLRFREMVNDTVGGVPILVSW